MQGTLQALHGSVREWRDLLADGPHLSVQDAACCEESITVAVVVEVLGNCTRHKSPVHDGLSYGYDCSMPDLFGY